METQNTNLLRARVDVFVLNYLSEKPGYGYDAIKHVKEQTEGHYEIKKSSAYSILNRLEDDGYLESYQGNETNGGKRKNYKLTEKGEEYLKAEKKEWEYTRTLLNNLVSDEPFDLKNDTPPFKTAELRPLTKRSTATPNVIEKEVVTTTIIQNTINESLSNNETDTTIYNENIVTEEPIEETFIAPTPVENTIIEQSVEEFSDIVENDLFIPEVPQITIPKPIEKENKIVNLGKTSKSDYIETLSTLFSSNEVKKNVTPKESNYDNINCSHINDLKNLLEKEGTTLKDFKVSTKKNYVPSFYCNKLNRDTSIIGYLFLIAMILIVGLTKTSFNTNWIALLVVSVLFASLPVYCIIQKINNPKKLAKAVVNIWKIIIISLAFYVAFLLINIIFALLIPGKFTITDSQIYAPSICALVVPFTAVVYSILYKTNNYNHIID